jgi:hypothetical protein
MLAILSLAVFAWVFTFLTREGEVLSFYGRLIDKIPYDDLYKPLGGCNRCFGGQVALWYYLIVHFHDYNFFEHIVFICATIFFVMLIDKIIDYES